MLLVIIIITQNKYMWIFLDQEKNVDQNVQI